MLKHPLFVLLNERFQKYFLLFFKQDINASKVGYLWVKTCTIDLHWPILDWPFHCVFIGDFWKCSFNRLNRGRSSIASLPYVEKNSIHCQAKSFSPNRCKICTRHPDNFSLKISTSEQDKTLISGVTADLKCARFAPGFIWQPGQIVRILQQKRYEIFTL